MATKNTLNCYKTEKEYGMDVRTATEMAELSISRLKPPIFCYLDKFSGTESACIRFRTRDSFVSFGEIVEVRIEKISESKVTISISSHAVAQMIDWGKSGRNVKNLFKQIDLQSKGLTIRSG